MTAALAVQRAAAAASAAAWYSSPGRWPVGAGPDGRRKAIKQRLSYGCRFEAGVGCVAAASRG